MKKRILSCLMALALCLTLLPTAALAEETEGTAQTPPAMEEAADPANGEVKQENQPAEAKQENQPAEQEEQQEDSASKQDGAVAAVQAMIDALPDAADLDGMDDTARESACLAASEAYEAYDALTEDQQSVLTGTENMIAILEWTNEQVALAANEDLSSHTNHDDWTAISTATELTGIDKAGNYYLTDNVTLTENEAWKPADGVVLCLNGKSIQASGNFDVITVNNGVTFTLCDCKSSGSTGKVTHSNGTGSGVYVNGTFNMYGGSISGNSAIYGGGVRIERTIKNPVFNMYGGEITNNKAASSGGFGGGVYVGTAVTFTMSGGSITGNKTSNGGGVYVNGTFTMSGGSITKNTVSDTKGIYYGGGVYVSESATFTVSGTVNITGNTAENGNANNVFLPFVDQSLKSFTIGKSGLASDSIIGVATNVAPNPGYYLTVATLSEGAAYIEGTIISDRTGGYAIKAKGNNINLYNGLPHEHYRCNGKDAATGGDKCTGIGGHTEEGVLSFKAWTSKTQLPTMSGEYYLTEDVTLDSAWSIKGTGGKQVRFVLCLNGHSIRLKDGVNDYVINVGKGGTLALCDCDGSGKNNGIITGSTNASGVYINKAGAFVMYGGSISGNDTGVKNNDLFQMYGGSITGNDCGVENLSGTFTMYDGSITGNRNTKYPYGKGGGVCVEGGAFDMHGGSITGNAVSGSTQSCGGGVYVDSNCRFTMDGGSITGNTAGDYGGGVYVNSNAFTVSGDVTISDNMAGSKASNVYLPSDKTITVGGKLTGGEASIGVTTANAPAENSYLTIANGVKYTLTEGDLNAFTSDSTYGKLLNSNSVIFTNGDLHTHAVCGETAAACKHTDRHSDAVWKPLTYNAEMKTLYYGGTAASKESKGFYKLPAGNYYLTGNITVDNYIDITGDVNLCLNGKTLSTSLVNTTGQNIAFILVDQNRTLTLCDCDPNGAGTIQTENTLTYGVQTGASGKLAMYGGKITGVECGVYAADQFAMYGGTITGTQRGVYAPKQFAMYGGTITGNTVYGVRPGDAATMIVGGDAKIESNATNVDLCAATITIDESLTQDARIGVRLLQNDVPAGTAKKQFATGANSSALNYGAIFSCDNGSKYVVSRDADGKLHFALHQHSWSYKADGATITAHCDATGCSLEDGLGGTLTLVPPTNPTYDGQPKRAETKPDQNWEKNIGAWEGASTYYRNGINVNSPIDAGEYKARYYVTGGENAVAEVTYTIAKATPTINWQGYPYNKTFTGSEIANPQKTDIIIHDGKNNNLDLFTEIAFKWYEATKNGSNYTKANETPLTANPIDAGDYIIEATIAATNNTESATITKGLTVNKATDLGGYDKTVPVAVDMYPSSAEKVYTVDLDKILAEKEIRSGGSLALNATLGIQTQSDWVNSAVLEGTTVKITMKALPSTNTGLTATVNVNLTSRNYKIIPVVITLTLQKKPTANDITVSMGDWTYGGTANAPVYTVPAGVTAEVTYVKADGTVLGERPTNAGDYTVTVSYETDNEIHTGTAEFTISPKLIEGATVTRDTSEQVYDGGEKKPAVTSVVLDGNTLTAGTEYAVAYANNINATKLGPDSQAKIIITGTGNYTGEVTVLFPINPVPLHIMGGEERMTATASYGTKVKDIPVSSTTVYYNSSKVTIVPGTWKFDGDGMDEIPEVGSTKVYRAVFTPTSGGENYRECFTYIKPSISQTAGSVTDPAAKTDLVYNGEEQALLETPPTSGTGTVLYSQDGTNYTEIPPMGREAKTYTVFYMVMGDKNHLNVAAQRISVEIKKLAITVTAENKTSRVGQTLAELTYAYTPELAAGDAFTGTLESNARPDAAGDYSITQGDLALNENYTIDFHAGTYTVANKLAQSDFRFESIPSAVSKTYGDPDFSAGAVGAAEGSTVTYESSEPAVAEVDSATGKVTIKGAGTAIITAKASATAEYDAAAVTCTLTVEKKPIAIPAADATVFTYNGTEQTYALAEDGAYTITGNKQTNANETGYAVTVALKDTANTQWADGTTADKTYTFVIGKAVITVKAKDQTAYVGDKAPTLGADSCTVSGLVGEEKLTTQPTVKYVGADGKEITPDMTKTGEVKILAGGAAASDNYTIRYEDGKLTVSTRPSGGGGGSRPSTHPVQAEVSKDPDGSVSLSKTSAAKGDKVTITVKPDRHYEVDEVIVRDSKGKQLAVKDNGDGTFTFEMPADKVTVEPTFTWVNPFADVTNSAYYVDAVEWMLKREVTQGTTDTTFSPNLNCTRAQIVTFLWRAAGSPEPKGTVSFADVSAGSYYAKAVAWAIENGITGGTGNGLFSPDAACTRAQSAAFLYRAAGSPAVSGSAGFSDVAADAYYAQAVAWAKEHGITDGIGGGLFGSANDCTRAQIAAFLWRLYAEK